MITSNQSDIAKKAKHQLQRGIPVFLYSEEYGNAYAVQHITDNHIVTKTGGSKSISRYAHHLIIGVPVSNFQAFITEETPQL